MTIGYTYMTAAYMGLWAFLLIYLLVLGVKVLRLERDLKLIKEAKAKKK